MMYYNPEKSYIYPTNCEIVLQNIVYKIEQLEKKLNSCHSDYHFAMCEVFGAVKSFRLALQGLHDEDVHDAPKTLAHIVQKHCQTIQDCVAQLREHQKTHDMVSTIITPVLAAMSDELNLIDSEHASNTIPHVHQQASHHPKKHYYGNFFFTGFDMQKLKRPPSGSESRSIRAARLAHHHEGIKLHRLKNTMEITVANLSQRLSEIMATVRHCLLYCSSTCAKDSSSTLLMQWLQLQRQQSYIVLGFIDSYSSVISEQHWPDFVVIANKDSNEAETVWLNQPVATPSLRG